MGHSRDVVIVEGIRTPFAKAGSVLKDVHPAELGKTALKELIARSNLDVKTVDEVIIGNTGNPADSVNIGRVVALNSGVPKEVSAHTVHRNCASAMEAITSGFDKIKAGSADVVLAGGTESMSNMPLLFSKEFTDVFADVMTAKSFGAKMAALSEMKLSYMKPVVSVMVGLTDPFVGINMGQTAEILAREFEISRETQDKFALESHLKAVAAQEAGRLAQEITPIYLPPKFEKVISEDVGPRKGQTLEALAKLKPFFDRKFGTITVGNACPITDGAAMILLMSREKAQALGHKILGSIKSYSYAGLEPERMGLGPALATPLALKKAGLKLSDLGLVELNEAFAAQVIACIKAMASKKFNQDRLGADATGELNPEILNVNGGAIALGHPVGATGTRLVVTLLKEMQRRNVQFGLATLCIGGGQGGAVIVERET
ncbi:MAG: thiolase family protein [Oligoflexia bacterium]|nr:thiolase family protein [Oligoflexia bacterium]